MTGPGLGDRLLAIAAALDHANFPFAFGGAIARNFYAEPRATIGLEINVFLPESGSVPVLATLREIGVPMEIERVAVQIERDGQARIPWDRVPVDLFFANVPFLEAAASRIRRVPFENRQIPILGAEDLAMCKILFNREKDWLDVREMLITGDVLNASAVSTLLRDLVGAADARTLRFAGLAEELRLSLDRIEGGGTALSPDHRTD